MSGVCCNFCNYCRTENRKITLWQFHLVLSSTVHFPFPKNLNLYYNNQKTRNTVFILPRKGIWVSISLSCTRNIWMPRFFPWVYNWAIRTQWLTVLPTEKKDIRIWIFKDITEIERCKKLALVFNLLILISHKHIT